MIENKNINKPKESNMDHLHGRSAPRPLRHAAKKNVKWDNYYI